MYDSIVGIFVDRASAERAVGNLRAVGISTKSIHVLVPGTSEPLVSRMPTSEAEQPGMGKAIGGVIGGAVGVASGASSARPPPRAPCCRSRVRRSRSG